MIAIKNWYNEHLVVDVRGVRLQLVPLLVVVGARQLPSVRCPPAPLENVLGEELLAGLAQIPAETSQEADAELESAGDPVEVGQAVKDAADERRLDDIPASPLASRDPVRPVARGSATGLRRAARSAGVRRWTRPALPPACSPSWPPPGPPIG